MRYQYIFSNKGKVLVFKNIFCKKDTPKAHFNDSLISYFRCSKQKKNRKLMLTVMNVWFKFTLSWK